MRLYCSRTPKYCQHKNKILPKIFISRGNFFFQSVFRAPPPTKSGQNIFNLVYLFIGSLWGGKSTFFWHSEIMENYIQNFRLFSLPKICFQKQCKITTKNLPYFSYQKINVWKGGPPPNQGRVVSSNFSIFSLPKKSKYLIGCHMRKMKIFLFLWIHVEKKK